MKTKISYHSNLVKGDLIEIYAKLIANKGPLTYFYEKSFSMTTRLPPTKGGNMGGIVTGYSAPLHAYIARHIMDTDGSVIHASMERGPLLYNNPSRKITLEQVADKELKVTVEGNKRSNKKVRKVLDQMFTTSEEDFLLVHKVIKFLQED